MIIPGIMASVPLGKAPPKPRPDGSDPGLVDVTNGGDGFYWEATGFGSVQIEGYLGPWDGESNSTTWEATHDDGGHWILRTIGTLPPVINKVALYQGINKISPSGASLGSVMVLSRGSSTIHQFLPLNYVPSSFGYSYRYRESASAAISTSPGDYLQIQFPVHSDFDRSNIFWIGVM